MGSSCAASSRRSRRACPAARGGSARIRRSRFSPCCRAASRSPVQCPIRSCRKGSLRPSGAWRFRWAPQGNLRRGEAHACRSPALYAGCPSDGTLTPLDDTPLAALTRLALIALHAARLHESREFAQRDRRAEDEALSEGGAALGDEVEVLGGFDALGDGLEAELLGEPDGEAQYGLLLHIQGDARDERTIELDRVERQPGEGCEVRIARSEIVDGEAYAQLAQQGDPLANEIGVAHRDRFGDLELEARRGEMRLAHGGDDIVDEKRVLDLGRRDVDAEHDVGAAAD